MLTPSFTHAIKCLIGGLGLRRRSAGLDRLRGRDLHTASWLTEKDLEVETGWAPPGKKVKVNRKVTGKSGKRVECMAAICSEGLLVVRFMRGGTIQWKNFRRHIIKHVLPRMNPWPLPRSVLVRPALAHGDVRVPSS